MTRRQHLEQLLRRYPETLGGFGAGTGQGDGDRSPRMPDVWHDPCVQELERCLRLLRDRYPRLYRHVNGRYIDTQRHALQVRLRDGRYHGLPPRTEVIVGAYAEPRNPRSRRLLPQQRTPGDPVERVLVASWQHWVRPEIASAGVTWIDRNYRLEPMLPAEMVAA